MATSVDFKLLGPMEILVDGQPRPLGSPAEKAVLAVLLLAGGRTVPRESLVDALWGEAPPNNPANAVQGRISRLRRALGLPAERTVLALPMLPVGGVVSRTTRERE